MSANFDSSFSSFYDLPQGDGYSDSFGGVDDFFPPEPHGSHDPTNASFSEADIAVGGEGDALGDTRLVPEEPEDEIAKEIVVPQGEAATRGSTTNNRAINPGLVDRAEMAEPFANHKAEPTAKQHIVSAESPATVTQPAYIRDDEGHSTDHSQEPVIRQSREAMVQPDGGSYMGLPYGFQKDVQYAQSARPDDVEESMGAYVKSAAKRPALSDSSEGKEVSQDHGPGFRDDEVANSPRTTERNDKPGALSTPSPAVADKRPDPPQPEQTESPKVDYDSQEFRKQSLARVHTALEKQYDQLTRILAAHDSELLKDYLINGGDELIRAILGFSEEDEVHPPPDMRMVVYHLGVATWRQPVRDDELAEEIYGELASRYHSGQMDLARLAKGVYLTDVLLHRYRQGNGRMARARTLLIERAAGEQPIAETDTSDTLAIGRSPSIQIDEYTYRLTVQSDLERLILANCYFALHLGFDYGEVVGPLRLNSSLPEDGLNTLAQQLGVTPEKLKEDYIHFITVESDLHWWAE
ncbi:MAG TPA: hypothetical protein VGS08_05965 [Candidatus Saccharimonadales bacterium]|nr:hypothetical protein [Candidatus Saccharimonadales bacterium]